MAFSDYSNNKKKKKTTTNSFSSWSNARHGITKEQEEEDAKKWQTYLSQRKNDDEDDIAPVGGNKDSWFKSGGFSDGVDGVGDFFGDLGQTIGGTVGDLGLGIVKGAGRIVEGLVDLGTYGVAGVADAFGADDFAEKTRKVARYSATDEWTKPATDFLDRYSVLGNKADAVSEGLGQVGSIILTAGVGAAAGLGTAAVTALTTGVTGLSSMGTGMGSAYDEGATDGEAFLYGLGSGAIEAGTELLFGSFGKTVKALGVSRGIGGLDDIFAKKLSSAITKSIANESVQKVLGNTAEYAIKSSGEGFEEVLSGLGSAVMKKLTYAEDEELAKLIEDENLLEQFVVGAITSSIVQGGDFVKATAGNTDFVTGLTTADEKVVDKVVKDEIAKREAEGKKLSIKEKNDIYDSVVDQMEKGQIDIDAIESTLGGDTYKAYTDAVESEEKLKAEYDELANIKKSELTTKQEDRLAELKAMNLDDTTKRDGLRKNLDDALSPMLKGSKLTESYRERERRGQAFEADLNKYKGKQREAVERAVKSGVLNNTYRSHELVDVLSKIETAKGISFDYTNNAKLKESGFAVEGKTVNGFANKKTGSVTLNVQSSKAWQSVVGHEITHVLEGTESYGALRDALYAYANSKGDLEGRRATLTELYHSVDAETDIDTELTADLVGDYLFTDRDFINHLTGNRTLFQKIYDEIKYLWNVATGKEKTEIERVKAEFDRAWKEYSAKGVKEADGKVRYSISPDSIKSIEEKYKDKTDYLFISERKNGTISIDNMVVKEAYRNQGIGTSILNDVIAYADANGKTITLTPTSEFGTKAKLTKWYKANGFVENKGKNTDFTLSDTMYRLPKKGVQYSLSDSDGNQLSKEQQDFFKDSKVRDENGNLKVMYHGTPSGDFTVFRDGTYFTEHKWYADVYQNPGASSINSRKTVTNPKTYKVYLDIKKPFDIADPEARDIYINDYIKGGNATGINPYLSDAEYAKIDSIDWTEGEDLRDFLIDNEYDYDGLVLDEGAVGGYGDDVKYRGKSYVIFSPEQVKDVENKAPTADPDIRFSLSKSVEETKDLMALHNLNADKLLKSLELGGMPMPSIAIARASDGFEEFGDISLVFSKDTIDPEFMRSNKIYSGDAWTPTYPRVEYKVNESVRKQVEKKIKSLVPYEIMSDLGRVSLDSSNIEDTVSRFKGDMAEAYRNDSAMKYAFLKDGGSDITLPMKEAPLYTYGESSNEAVRYFAGKLVNGLQTVELYQNMSASDLLQDKDLKEGVADAQNFDVLRTLEPGSDEYLAYERNPVFHADEVAFRDIQNFLSASRKLFTTGIQQAVDYKAAREFIDDQTDQNAYEAWLREQFAGIVEKEGIRNNVDYFTPSGNRRSFEATHWENTLENVVRAMKETGEKGIGNFGGGNIFGASTKEFTSIADVKKSTGRLQNIPEEEYEKMKNEFRDRFFELASSLPENKRSFTAADDAANMLIEAVVKYKTKNGMANYIRRESQGWAKYSPEVVDELIDIVNDIRAMPTGYFEAKPQRAVGFDEVGVFVIPRNADVKLKQELLNRGYSIAEYDPDVEGDRQRVVNGFEEYKFSLSNVGEESAPIGNYRTPFRELALEESAPVSTDTPTVQKDTPTVQKDTPTEETAASPSAIIDKASFASDKASDLYEEVRSMRKGVRVSRELGYLLDHLDLSEESKSESYDKLRTALLNIKNRPDSTVNESSNIEAVAREMISDAYDETVYGADGLVAIKLKAVEENIAKNEADRKEAYESYEQQIARKQAELDSRIAPTTLGAVKTQLANLESKRQDALESYNTKIAQKQAELESKKNKDTKVANNLRMQIENLTRLRDSVDAEYTKRMHRLENGGNNPTKLENNLKMQIERLRQLQSSTDAQYANSISKLEERAKKMRDPKFSRAMRARAKMQEHAQYAADLLGNTATWKDKKFGLQYAANTERRNLRDIVRDANGKADIARADRIDDALNGQYNRDEAARKRELSQKRGKYAELKITSAEDAYIQMLGELRYNPDTELTGVSVAEYYEKHKSKIDTEKVDKIIEMARQDYDEWFERVNAELRAQGMREIPYRQGYFPHFREPKQNFVQKLLNWKTQDNEIPTSIAGLTETFRPKKSWQSFDKTRTGDKTEYSFTKGYDKYSDGVTDWIYHLDTLQKRRAVENHIRLTHSDEGIQQQIRQVYAREDLDADEAQAEIGRILAEANNPLNNFVQDFTTHTNILAGKKNSLDRTLEQWTNRDIYTVMSNVQNRVSANMVLANVRSALTNFIPITQSWAQVSPAQSLKAAKETIANAIKDDGAVDKSTFLTNRLREADKLYQSNWDKVIDKAGIMFEIVDNFSSQVIWRSKYNQNLANGMSEDAAIKNADQFAENVMAGRSKGNEPTLFNAKNPLVKAFTAFQLEVTNQYGYLLKDVPNDLKAETNHWKLNLAKGYATAFVGAHIYNALLEKITGSEAALDPIGIIEELLRDLGMFDDDEEKEPKEALENLKDNVLEQMPFVGGYLGGGRFPISNALPIKELVSGKDSYGNEISRVETALEALPYTLLPFGYGQIKKTAQGLNMFSDEHPVSGSYTNSGNLRFPVEDTPLNRAQAAIFGQYASENAREYFDNGYAPLKEKQIQEYIDVDIPIADYWKYRKGLAKQDKLEDKLDYISGLDLPVSKKNILANNVTDRKEPIDLTNYDDFGSLEEFDFATKQPEKYAFAKSVGGYSAYKRYSGELGDIKSDKDANGKTINGSRKEKVIDYINNLDADYYTKIILLKSEYPSEDSYNAEIIEYLNSRDDITYEEQVSILTELGFRVTADGQIYAD